MWTSAPGRCPVVATIKSQLEEVTDPDNQDVGIFFLSALDEVETLVGFWKDRLNTNVRGASIFALQCWLTRGSGHAAELMGILERRRDATREKAEKVIRLLHFYAPEDLEKRKTYEDLIGNLDDDNLLVRDLSLWHLDQLGAGGRLPEEARGMRYEPTWGPEQRRPAVEQWRRLLAQGKIPVPPRR
jgi:hypothetical protein